MNGREIKLPQGDVARASVLVDPLTGDELSGAIDPYGYMKIIDTPRSSTHRGESFEASVLLTLAASASAYVLGITGANLDAHLHQFFVDADGAPVLIEFFEAPTVTANGTAQTVLNHNRQLAATSLPEMTVFTAPTISAAGDRLAALRLYGTQRAVNSNELDSEWLLKRATPYIFKLTNQSAASIDLTVGLTWIEQNKLI